MKIRDNETGEVFEYGINIHHALRISRNGGCLTFENLQNGDGSLKSGDGGYSFVLDDGKTPEESTSPDAIYGATYADIGGFYGDNTKNDGWIPVEERLPEDDVNVLVTYADIDDENYTDICITTYGYAYLGGNKLDFKEWRSPFEYFKTNYKVIAWRPLPEPYLPERSE